MSAPFPCPNPSCNYVFSREQLRGTTALRCPRCGRTFQFQAVPSAAPPLAKFPIGPIVQPRLMRTPQGGGWRTGLILGVSLVLVIGFAVGGVLVTMSTHQSEEESAKTDANVLTITGNLFNKKGDKERAFRLLLPRHVWQGDEELKLALKAVVALRRTGPDAWLAVAAEDFGARMPREAELLKGGIKRLENYFRENLQMDEHPASAELAGRPAQVLRFRGMANEVQWEGECYLLARHGLGYWFFLAGAPSMETAHAVLAELQEKGKGLHLDDERQGWTELPPAPQHYSGANFTLAASKEVWQSFPNASDEDPNAQVLLRGWDVEDKKDNLKSASILVLVLKKVTPDLKAAMKEARAYLEDSKKQEGRFRFTPLAAKKGEAPPADGTPRKIGNQPGQVLELQMLSDETPVKYVLLGVVRTPERLYVFQCEAHWAYHQAWRQDFLDVLGTFRLRSG
jgi:hypothetical protein